jgi:hypothetical protein
MRSILHILAQPNDALARELVARQKSVAGNKVEIVDLRLPEPDYKDLLEKIFAAESIECW